MSSKQKGFITASTLLTLFLAMPFASTIWMKAMATPLIYGTAGEAPKSDLAVALGAAVYNPQSVSPILEDRLDTAIALLNQGKVKKLFLTGAPNEVEAMKNYVKTKGATDDQIIPDPKGSNTLASIQNIPDHYRNRKITIVTQRFHLPRALFYARQHGFKAIGVAADRHEYAKIYDFEKREVLAASKAILEVLTGQFPLFDLF